ncbi:MAG: DUF928 domain-containing protein [Calothrix sp. C42_A2020_038]|nr:DUF928 domain-containing protein [Calothrix sp. C42_A2020_038]
MTRIKFYESNAQIVKAFIVVALCTSCGRLYGQRITENSDSASDSTLVAIKYEPPPRPPKSGEPTGRAQGGAGRGCEPTALMPVTKSSGRNFLWGLTVNERPQFWFSLPRKMTTKDAIEFVLKDSSGKEIYKTMLKNSEIPKGIISFAIPEKTQPLQIDQSYNWSFSVYCDFKTLEDKPGNVQGSIQRVSTPENLKTQLAGAKTPVEQATIYAKNGIWFDAVTTLAINMRDKKSKDIVSAWNDLLKQVNLEKTASLSVTNCCTQLKTPN